MYRYDNDKDKFLFYVQKYQKEFDFEDELSEYRSERTVLERNFKLQVVIRFVESYTDIDERMFKWKYKRETKECRALCVFLVRYYCDFTYSQICSLIGRLTLTRVSELSKIGLELIEGDERYQNVMEDFISYRAA